MWRPRKLRLTSTHHPLMEEDTHSRQELEKAFLPVTLTRIHLKYLELTFNRSFLWTHGGWSLWCMCRSVASFNLTANTQQHTDTCTNKYSDALPLLQLFLLLLLLPTKMLLLIRRCCCHCDRSRCIIEFLHRFKTFQSIKKGFSKKPADYSAATGGRLDAWWQITASDFNDQIFLFPCHHNRKLVLGDEAARTSIRWENEAGHGVCVRKQLLSVTPSPGHMLHSYWRNVIIWHRNIHRPLRKKHHTHTIDALLVYTRSQ